MRKALKKARESIAPSRRSAAETRARYKLLSLSEFHPFVLSYHSFGSELNTHQINLFLAQQGKLLLPRVTGDLLKIFHIADLSQLVRSPWGIWEPNPLLCQEVKPELATLAFIPGLAFNQNHRIGYGKGFYDRLLNNLSPKIVALGIAFEEQYLDAFPIHSQDAPLSKNLFF